MKRFPKSIIVVLFISLLFCGNAYAYLDLGSGSYVFQFLIAGFLGLLYAVKLYWNQIKAFIKKLFSKKKG